MLPGTPTAQFGKWYYGPDAKELTSLSVFRAIGEEHTKFHDLAKRIAELCRSDRRREAAEKLDEVRSITQRLFPMLDELEREVHGRAFGGLTYAPNRPIAAGVAVALPPQQRAYNFLAPKLVRRSPQQ